MNKNLRNNTQPYYYQSNIQKDNLYEAEIINYKAMKRKSTILTAVFCTIYLFGIVMAITFGIISLINGKQGADLVSEEKDSVHLSKVYNDSNDSGYVLKDNGEIITFEMNSSGNGYMTRDRKHIVVIDEHRVRLLDKNGEALLTVNCDMDQSFKLIGTSNKAATVELLIDDSLDTIQNNIIEDYNKDKYYFEKIDINGLQHLCEKEGYEETVQGYLKFYKDFFEEDYYDVYEQQKKLYYCDFQKEKLIQIAENHQECWLARYDNVAYFIVENELYEFDSSMSEPKRIYSKERDELSLQYTSTYRDIVLWADRNDSENTLYTYNGKKVLRFAEINGKSDFVVYEMDRKDNICCVSAEQNIIVYGNVDGSDTKVIPLDHNVTKYGKRCVYDKEGIRDKANLTHTIVTKTTISSEGIYVFLDSGSENADLYYVSFERNDARKVNGDIGAISYINNGKVVYVTYAGNLMIGTFNNEFVEDSIFIDSNVDYLQFCNTANVFASNFSNIYYEKTKYEENVLYYWNGEESQVVAKDVSYYEMYMLSNGKCLYGVGSADVRNPMNGYYIPCAKKYYIADKAESTLLAENTVKAIFLNTRLDSEDIYLYCADQSDMDEESGLKTYYKMYHYDGKKSTLLKEGLTDQLDY